MSYNILGYGKFGCVVAPPIPCSNRNMSNKVSKIAAVRNDKTFQKHKDEYDIGRILRKLDPTQRYFLAADELCTLKHHEKYDLIYKCLQNDKSEKREDPRKRPISNFIIERGISFSDIFFQLSRDYGSVLYVIGHLMQGMKIIAQQKMAMLDVRSQNMLFSAKNNDLYPVFIDFSIDHIVGFSYPLSFYAKAFKSATPKYPPWPPEVKVLVREAYTNSRGSVNYAAHVLINSEKETPPELRVYTSSVITDIERQIEEGVAFVKSKTRNDRIKINTGVSEKIMIWSLFTSIRKSMRDLMYSMKGSKFYDMIVQSLHPNIMKRPFCKEWLDFIEGETGAQGNFILDRGLVDERIKMRKRR